MAACRAEASGIRYCSAGDATCEGGVIGNDGEDRPQGCARACPADPDGLVPSGARQIDGLAGGAGTVGCAQAASWAAYRTLKVEYEKLHKSVLTIVREAAVCRRLMTVPSVGPLVAITYKTAMDDPNRIAKSKAAGALFGLTPKKYQSGEKDLTGGITRAGDEMVRTALYEAANVLLACIIRFSKLKRRGMDVAKRRGSKRAKVALARKIAVILHRMWVDGTTYRWTDAQPIAAQA